MRVGSRHVLGDSSVQDFNLDPVYKSTGGGSSTPCIPPCRFRWSPLESVAICAIFNLKSPLGCRWSPLGWRLVGRPGSAGSPRSLGHPASSTAIIHHRVYMRVSAIFAQKRLLTVHSYQSQLPKKGPSQATDLTSQPRSQPVSCVSQCSLIIVFRSPLYSTPVESAS